MSSSDSSSSSSSSKSTSRRSSTSSSGCSVDASERPHVTSLLDNKALSDSDRLRIEQLLSIESKIKKKGKKLRHHKKSKKRVSKKKKKKSSGKKSSEDSLPKKGADLQHVSHTPAGKGKVKRTRINWLSSEDEHEGRAPNWIIPEVMSLYQTAWDFKSEINTEFVNVPREERDARRKKAIKLIRDNVNAVGHAKRTPHDIWHKLNDMKSKTKQKNRELKNKYGKSGAAGGYRKELQEHEKWCLAFHGEEFSGGIPGTLAELMDRDRGHNTDEEVDAVRQGERQLEASNKELKREKERALDNKRNKYGITYYESPKRKKVIADEHASDEDFQPPTPKRIRTVRNRATVESTMEITAEDIAGTSTQDVENEDVICLPDDAGDAANRSPTPPPTRSGNKLRGKGQSKGKSGLRRTEVETPKRQSPRFASTQVESSTPLPTISASLSSVFPSTSNDSSRRQLNYSRIEKLDDPKHAAATDGEGHHLQQDLSDNEQGESLKDYLSRRLDVLDGRMDVMETSVSKLRFAPAGEEGGQETPNMRGFISRRFDSVENRVDGVAKKFSQEVSKNEDMSKTLEHVVHTAEVISNGMVEMRTRLENIETSLNDYGMQVQNLNPGSNPQFLQTQSTIDAAVRTLQADVKRVEANSNTAQKRVEHIYAHSKELAKVYRLLDHNVAAVGAHSEQIDRAVNQVAGYVLKLDPPQKALNTTAVNTETFPHKSAFTDTDDLVITNAQGIQCMLGMLDEVRVSYDRDAQAVSCPNCARFQVKRRENGTQLNVPISDDVSDADVHLDPSEPIPTNSHKDDVVVDLSQQQVESTQDVPAVVNGLVDAQDVPPVALDDNSQESDASSVSSTAPVGGTRGRCGKGRGRRIKR